MPFNHKDYTVFWSPYVGGIITAAEDQTQAAAIRDVLEYEAEQVIAKGPGGKTAYVLARILRNPNPVELCVVIDPDAHTIFFGTEAEVRRALDA
jgi:hypothetical protein